MALFALDVISENRRETSGVPSPRIKDLTETFDCFRDALERSIEDPSLLSQAINRLELATAHSSFAELLNLTSQPNKYALLKLDPKEVSAFGEKLREEINPIYVSERDAIRIMKTAGALPLEPFQGQRKKWRSKCLKCFREIAPPFGNVRAGHAPCQYCSGKKVDPQSAYDFAITRGVKPLQKFPGATQRWKVRCLRCERITTVSWVNLQLKKKNSGCSSCTEFGFKPLEPAYLYLITHPTKNAHKIGIGNTEARRIEKHLKNGWKIYKILEFKKGSQAHLIEQQIISWLREEKYLGPAYRTGDGWTETVKSNDISLQSIWRKVTELSKDKGTLVRNSLFN